MIKTEVNTDALEAAVKLIYGDQANDLVSKTYQALDAAMFNGYQQGVKDSEGDVNQDDWDAGYDAGFTDAESFNGQSSEVGPSLVAELENFLHRVGGMHTDDAMDLAETFVDHWAAISNYDNKPYDGTDIEDVMLALPAPTPTPFMEMRNAIHNERG